MKAILVHLSVLGFIFLFANSAPVYARGGGHGGGHAGHSSHSSTSTGHHSVRGFVRSNGTYVAPHHATNPNHTRSDNWS